jgi:CRISPR-associated protein Cas2
MMVLVLTACPVGLRGDLTKWLMEISPGVFVGRPSARVRDQLWLRTIDLCKDGRAILVHSAANEQGMEFRVHNHDWIPVDFDGIRLMLRETETAPPQRRTGWSNARAMRRSRRPNWNRPSTGTDA